MVKNMSLLSSSIERIADLTFTEIFQVLMKWLITELNDIYL